MNARPTEQFISHCSHNQSIILSKKRKGIANISNDVCQYVLVHNPALCQGLFHRIGTRLRLSFGCCFDLDFIYNSGFSIFGDGGGGRAEKGEIKSV